MLYSKRARLSPGVRGMEDMHTMSDGAGLNISDVLDVLQQNIAADQEMKPAAAPGPPAMSAAGTRPKLQPTGKIKPYLQIVEQPASKALRFRYECEGRSAGSIPGVNNTPDNKTFPTIRIVGYKGRAVVVVSCVTKDPPYRPHPHNLVGKDVCKNGVCKVNINSDNMTYVFDKLGIQCVKRKEIENHLLKRQAEKVDPFNTGFDHRKQPTSIDLNAVRLCFQVFLDARQKGKFYMLDPVVSDPIYDKKAMSDLTICKLSHCTATVAGGMEMVLLCEKVTKEDIEVRFFEVSKETGQRIWEAKADFQPVNVHKQVAISFRTPSYKDTRVKKPVEVYVQLFRPSDGVTSEPLDFTLLPIGLDDVETLKRKRQKCSNSPTNLLRQAQVEAEKNSSSRIVGSSVQQQQCLIPIPQPQQPYNFNFNVKPEPMDRISPRDRISSNGRISPFGGPSTSNSPVMFGGNILQPTPVGVQQQQIFHQPPGHTQSPLICPMYNLPASGQMQQMHQMQTISSQLEPIILPQVSSPQMHQDPMLGNGMSNVQMNNFQQGGGNIISSAIGNALNIGNVLGEQPVPTSDFDMSFSAFDGVDLNSLNISDIVREAANEVAGANPEESGMTDSFTRLTRNTMHELDSLNNL